MHIIPITSSLPSSSKVIPRTPVAVRPITRTALSWKRMARPLRLAMIISLLPFVMRTSITLSSSRIVIAFTPFCRGREYCSSNVFLITPFFVQNKT